MRSLEARGRSVDPESVRYSSSQRLHDTGRVEHDSDGYGEHHELDEAGDLASEEEENRDDPHDTEEQRPEQALQVCDQVLRAECDWSRRGSEMRKHKTSLPGLIDPFA